MCQISKTKLVRNCPHDVPIKYTKAFSKHCAACDIEVSVTSLENWELYLDSGDDKYLNDIKPEMFDGYIGKEFRMILAWEGGERLVTARLGSHNSKACAEGEHTILCSDCSACEGKDITDCGGECFDCQCPSAENENAERYSGCDLCYSGNCAHSCHSQHNEERIYCRANITENQDEYVKKLGV